MLGEIPVTPLELAVAWAVTFCGALLQGAVGFGFAVLSVPLLRLVNPALTPIPQILLALPLTLAATWRERSQLDLRGVGWVLAGRVPGALLGAWVLTVAATRMLDLIIGVVTLAAVVAVARGAGIRLTAGSRLLAGLASGFTGSTSAIGEPPLALLYRTAAGRVIRSSLGAIFTLGLLVNISALALAGAMSTRDLRVALWLTPPLLLGFGVSHLVHHLVEGAAIQRAIFAVSGAAALLLLLRAVLGF